MPTANPQQPPRGSCRSRIGSRQPLFILTERNSAWNQRPTATVRSVQHLAGVHADELHQIGGPYCSSHHGFELAHRRGRGDGAWNAFMSGRPIVAVSLRTISSNGRCETTISLLTGTSMVGILHPRFSRCWSWKSVAVHSARSWDSKTRSSIHFTGCHLFPYAVKM